jgi:hypothetical protein
LFIHAFSCQTNASWWWESDTNVGEHLLFQKMLGGLVGQLNGDWDFRHDLALQIWLDKLREAEPGDWYAYLLWDALEEIEELLPRYADGVGMIGAHLVVPPLDPAGVEVANDIRFKVTRRSTSDGEIIDFALPEDARVNMAVFDLGGRRVAKCVNNEIYPVGRHSVLWDRKNAEGRDVATGVYFIRLQASTTENKYTHSEKLVLVW